MVLIMSEEHYLFKNFVEEIISLLEMKDFSTAVSFFTDTQHKEFLKNKSWDLIPIFCKNITREAKLRNVNVAKRSEKLLEELAKEANPEEAILEFLDQMDDADTEKFSVILRLLYILLCRDIRDNMKSLEWVLNSIRSYTEQYSYSKNLNDFELQNDLDNVISDERIIDIKNIMTPLMIFYDKIIKKINESVPAEETKVLLSSRLIQIFDIFLPYVNIDSDPRFKAIVLKLISLVFELIPNPMSLLKYMFFRSVTSTKSNLSIKEQLTQENMDINKISDDNSVVLNLNDNLSPFEDETIVSNLAYGMFYYSLLSVSGHEKIRVPLLYNPKYVMLSLINVVVSFLDNKPNITVMKGLKFLDLLLNHLEGVLTKSDLYFSSHKAILILLNNVMIYSQVEANRKLAVKCFKKYIESFNWEGRYLLLLNLRSHVTHSGSLGFLINLVKEFISHFLELPKNSHLQIKYIKYYKGKLLFDIIKTYCFLRNISNTDLVGNADHIMSSLNILRYLVLRDKRKDIDLEYFISDIYSEFLNPLQKNIISSKNYYVLKLKDLENSQNNCNIGNSHSKVDISLSVMGENLPKLTDEEQKLADYSCLNAIDLINSLLIRLTECIEEVYPHF